ncbi:hypothetical protein [Streptomyces rochei]|uniref:hypothetical protein n=1 Tax=Streptomyces rochei TaxID=1928 RepID=UPI0022E9DA20|nr:hypothetical protein [Streptomyces rochei]MCC8455595.1 hypothetical protein [Streptomyces rochei]
MPGMQHPTTPEETQPVELHPPVDDDGWYASQVRDWVSVCPDLSEAAVRLYLILRALVVDKRGPVRKLTLWELCHLMPSKGAKKGVVPSSVSRIRNLLRELTEIGLVTTPEGLKLTTSSRALAAGRGLRLRINLMPVTAYTGPRNVFDALDSIRDAAAESAYRARVRELELAAEKRSKRSKDEAGQNSDPQGTGEAAGQNSDPRGQNSDPRGQNSDPHSGADLQDHEPPLSPSAQSFRSANDGVSVRPSVQVAEVQETDGRTAGSAHKGEGSSPGAAGQDAAQAGDTSDNRSDETAVPSGAGRPSAGSRETTPGMEVLTRVGRVNPELALAGGVLMEQAGKLDQRIAASEAAGEPWALSDLVTVLSAAPGGPIRVSAGAIVAARIRQLPPTPRTRMVPAQPTREPSSSLGADRSVDEALGRRTLPECPECGDHSPGGVLCGACSGWPMCDGGCGRRLADGGTCEACREAVRGIERPPAEDGTCAGYDGPCGKPVLTVGLCGKCRIKAEAAKETLASQWAAQVATVTAMSDDERAAVEAGVGTPPF